MNKTEIEQLAMERRDNQESEAWYQVNYCVCCGTPTGVDGPDACEFCGDTDYFPEWAIDQPNHFSPFIEWALGLKLTNRENEMIKPVYKKCSQSEFLLECIAQCEEILKKPEVIYPNGRNSHEAAYEEIDRCEDELIDYICLEVAPDQLTPHSLLDQWAI